MKCKKPQLLFSVLLMLSFSSVGQSISVGLSIRWEKTAFVDTTLVIPFLDVTYQNLSDSAYYCPRTSRFFDWSGVTTFDWSILPRRLVGNYDIYLFFPSTSYWRSWEIIPDTVDYTEKHEMFYVEIRRYIQAKFDKTKRYPTQEEMEDWESFRQDREITPDAVMNKIYRRMVFLKPHENFVESFSLIELFLLKGNYKIFLYNDNYEGMMVKPVWDENTQQWNDKTLKLPEVVGEYHLYKGDFYSNMIILEIDK